MSQVNAPSKKTMQDRINELATPENAKAYAAAGEPFLFCVDLLEISAHHPLADEWINALEDKFDELNREGRAHA
jgi:hypothetical protein